MKTHVKGKWHPLTHAIFNANVDFLRSLFQKSAVNVKKAVKVPGLYSTSEINKLFAFYVALAKNNQ